MLPASPLSLNDMQRGNVLPGAFVELVELADSALCELSRNADRRNDLSAVAMDEKQSVDDFGLWRSANEAIHVSPRNCVTFGKLSRAVPILNPHKTGGVQ
jgi:hypothetical protein